MSREKKCSWHFGREGQRDVGANSMSEMIFSEGVYQTLVREAIQNSLDAVLDKSMPVVVKIESSKLKKVDFKNFFMLKDHIQSCVDYYGEMAYKFKNMLKFFGGMELSTEIGYIKVTDSNTTGMEYVENDNRCEFYRFAFASGVSDKKDNSSGGSFGFGKTAYFQMSPIRTIFVSSYYHKNNSHSFIGIAELCTHMIKGEKKAYIGYYYDENESDEKITPITNYEEIPVPFRCKEPGTSICILGADVGEKSKEKAKNEMVKAVLCNYWLAIWEEKLVVEIFGEVINKETITNLMENTFPEKENISNNRNKYNPRPYFDAVCFAQSDDREDCILIKDTLKNIGEVDLYIKKDKEAKDKVVYMRQNLMLIYHKRKPSNYGYNALFVCRGDRGNQILKNLENPRHDEWKPKNCIAKFNPFPNDSSKNLGKEVLKAIEEFIDDSIKKLFHSDNIESVDVTGLEEYLYIEENLASGESLLSKDKQSTLPSASINKPAKVDKPESSQIGFVIVTHKGSHSSDLDAGQPIGVGHMHTGIGGRPKNSKGSNKKQRAALDEFGEGTFWEYIPIQYRIVAQRKDNKIYHDIIIHSDVSVDNGRIELVVGGEQREEIVQILETSEGSIKNNYVDGLKINEGKNVFSIRFNDNLKHVVILKAYESKK